MEAHLAWITFRSANAPELDEALGEAPRGSELEPGDGRDLLERQPTVDLREDERLERAERQPSKVALRGSQDRSSLHEDAQKQSISLGGGPQGRKPPGKPSRADGAPRDPSLGAVSCSSRIAPIPRLAAVASAIGVGVALGFAACASAPAASRAPGTDLGTHVTDSHREADAAADAHGTSAAEGDAATLDDASAPAPPYDLAADRTRIVDLARTELGGSIATTIAQESFVLVAAPGWNASALQTSKSLATRAIDAYFNGRFDKRPARAVAIYLFPDGPSYQAYCKAHMGGECPSVFGVYHPDVRRIVMNAGPGLGTLTHEIVHPIVETDFPGAPTWIDEGLASLFEAPVLPRDGEIHGMKNWRLPRLISGMNAPTERDSARVDALFGMTNETFRDGLEKLHYATARYVCQWLDERGLLWPFYRQWREGVKADPTGEKTFTKVVGMTPAQANVPWTAWVKKL